MMQFNWQQPGWPKAGRYETELRGLASRVGERNTLLLPLARLGLRAGRDAATLEAEIISAGGEPRLSESEVRRAIEKAMLDNHLPKNGHCSRNSHNRGKKRHVAPRPSTINTREQGFVREMIDAGKGTKSSDLIALSRSTFHEMWTDEERGWRIEGFLRRLFKPGELIFAGTPLLPRTRENLKTLEQLIDELSAPNAVLPTHFIPNPFTGKPGVNSEGKESYCLDSTIAHRRMALVEFDALPLAEQAAFWMGAIKTRLLPVRSLVYSGAKSIHGLIELRDDIQWAEQWRNLERLLCSDPDAAYRADRACKNASRFTRFPGARRPETTRLQQLIW